MNNRCDTCVERNNPRRLRKCLECCGYSESGEIIDKNRVRAVPHDARLVFVPGAVLEWLAAQQDRED